MKETGASGTSGGTEQAARPEHTARPQNAPPAEHTGPAGTRRPPGTHGPAGRHAPAGTHGPRNTQPAGTHSAAEKGSTTSAGGEHERAAVTWLIRGARLAGGEQEDVLIRDGVIAETGRGLTEAGAEG